MGGDSKYRAAATLADPRWRALEARDARSDGTFFYSVRTTGVYCRPSCASRAARPEHVTFHASAQEAEQAGFRPCRRCRPDQPGRPARHAALVAKLCRYMDGLTRHATLAELAQQAGMSPYHLQRVFKTVTGISPAAYSASKRAQRMRQSLERSPSVTDAIYAAGFSTSSRFYQATAGVLGMTPTRYRKGGAGSEIEFATRRCSLGCVLVARSERGICAILLGDAARSLQRELQQRYPRANLRCAESGLRASLAAVVRSIEAPAAPLELPLDVRGTAFQQRVWQALRHVPVGARITYSELARRIGEPRSVRAVAGACGANPLAVVIPCHRVVAANGGLAGYRWGLERKRQLLQREQADPTAQPQPSESARDNAPCDEQTGTDRAAQERNPEPDRLESVCKLRKRPSRRPAPP